MISRIWGIARSLVMYHGVPGRRRRMVRLYRAFLGPGDIGFDIGAHTGSRVRAWRRLGARVVAVEPQPDFVRILRLFFGGDRDVTIMAADVPSNMQYQPIAGCSVSLSGDDGDLLRGYWERLSGSGSIMMPLEKQVWGDEFGMCVDQFGVPWLVNVTAPQAG